MKEVAKDIEKEEDNDDFIEEVEEFKFICKSFGLGSEVKKGVTSRKRKGKKELPAFVRDFYQ